MLHTRLHVPRQHIPQHNISVPNYGAALNILLGYAQMYAEVKCRQKIMNEYNQQINKTRSEICSPTDYVLCSHYTKCRFSMWKYNGRNANILYAPNDRFNIVIMKIEPFYVINRCKY